MCHAVIAMSLKAGHVGARAAARWESGWRDCLPYPSRLLIGQPFCPFGTFCFTIGAVSDPIASVRLLHIFCWSRFPSQQVFHLLRKRLKDRFDKQMARIVMKFGGTSMAGRERIGNVAAGVKHVADPGHQ